jgi:predicted amidohydrolase YtcJ
MVLKKLNEYLDANPHITPDSGLWLTGMGWDQNIWTPAVFPTAADLDTDPRLSKIPTILTRIDAHAVWVNGRALELAKKYIPNEDSPGGKIVRDAQQNPTGVFIDDAIKYMGNNTAFIL